MCRKTSDTHSITLLPPVTHQVINSIKDITEDEWDSVAKTSVQTEGRQQHQREQQSASPQVTAADQAEEGDLPAGDKHEHGENEVNPFVLHAFLSALEASGSVTPATGWLPRHLVVR